MSEQIREYLNNPLNTLVIGLFLALILTAAFEMLKNWLYYRQCLRIEKRENEIKLIGDISDAVRGYNVKYRYFTQDQLEDQFEKLSQFISESRTIYHRYYIYFSFNQKYYNYNVVIRILNSRIRENLLKKDSKLYKRINDDIEHCSFIVENFLLLNIQADLIKNVNSKNKRIFDSRLDEFAKFESSVMIQGICDELLIKDND